MSLLMDILFSDKKCKLFEHFYGKLEEITEICNSGNQEGNIIRKASVTNIPIADTRGNLNKAVKNQQFLDLSINNLA